MSRLLPILVLGSLALAGCRLAAVPPAPAPPPSAAVAPPHVSDAEPPAAPAPLDAGAGDDASVEAANVPAPVEAEGPTHGPPRPVRTFEEVRALWVVRTTLTHPDSIRQMVQRSHAAGFNTLIVQVRGRGDAYYRGGIEPRAAVLRRQPPEFDPLAVVLEEGHARGMAVHAWVNTYLVHGVGPPPDDPAHLVRARPELLAVPRGLARELFAVDPQDPRYGEALRSHVRQNIGRIEGLYTSPSHPHVSDHVYAVWMDLAERYDVDGIHFDYVRYPSSDFDYSRRTLDAFRERMAPLAGADRRRSLDAAYARDPFAWTAAYPAEWDEFRREGVTALVRRIYHGVKARRPELVVSAAIFPVADDAYRHRFQDWRAWLREGILDAVAPMAYTSDDTRFLAQVGTAVQAAREVPVWAGIGAYQNTLRGTLRKIDMARDAGAGGIALFSYDWAVQSGESDRPGRPYLERIGEEAFGRGR